jgi:hypothetical protein
LIYLDNAATIWPKPDSVWDSVVACENTKGDNPGRSGHRLAVAADREVSAVREAVAALFNAEHGPAAAPPKRRSRHHVFHGAQLGPAPPAYPAGKRGDHVHGNPLQPPGRARPGRREEGGNQKYTACRPDPCVKRLRNRSSREGGQEAVAGDPASGRCGPDSQNSAHRRSGRRHRHARLSRAQGLLRPQGDERALYRTAYSPGAFYPGRDGNPLRRAKRPSRNFFSTAFRESERSESTESGTRKDRWPLVPSL